MLPLLRMTIVGGVFIAMIALGLGLSLPVASYARIPAVEAPARGPLIDTGEHPEWRQFLMLAAVRRAVELDRLRRVPDRASDNKAARHVAGLPADRPDADPDDLDTGSIVQTPGASLPMDIGETSSTELPVASPGEEERPPVTTPERLGPAKERKPARKARRGKPPAKAETTTTFNLFGTLFGNGGGPGSTTQTGGAH
jgi:hypothetical protein